ncbi:energy-coupling factor ABC transporter ATP-binding protein [Brockia lithotrophica]|uniref:Cobalt/nickel transport system ATP-binding protein n=1 Tax=Brockia lithotrophica TaxID=933949 RepID=A0A660L826_9BACL|nr:ATP-binding cassette domain-containing protein [Brockia lithotrophica]RKQ88982.1 cobalt/nickel transport system ATP-binding protein [Brockia lithotrophica]
MVSVAEYSVALSEELFRVEGVHFRYREGSPWALRGVDFVLRRRRRVAFVGANGSGKTTTFFVLRGLFTPEKGRVAFRGTEVYPAPTLPAREREKLLQSVGILFQDPDDMLISLTVLEDVAFTPLHRGLPWEEAERRARAALARLGIESLADRPPRELSFGQKKLVALAGLLAAEPEVLLLDEPMAFLDPRGRRLLLAILEDLFASGVDLVVATHDMRFVARWAEDVVVLSEGTVLFRGSPAELFRRDDVLDAAGLEDPGV